MRTIVTTHYLADDGTVFTNEERCRNHEERNSKRVTLFESKLGPFTQDELTVGHGVCAVLDLPCVAPWLGPFGACSINIINVKRDKDGKVLFQLGDEDCKPYENGESWAYAENFYNEWPQ